MNTNNTQIRQKENDGVGGLNTPSYRDGYVYGRTVEHDIQRENRIIRENNNAGDGLLIGISLTILAGLLGVSTIFIMNTSLRTTDSVESAPVPATSQPRNP